MKGVTICNRTACQKPLTPGAIYYNSSTEANYCPHCAFLINGHNPNLCKLIKEPIPQNSKEKLFKELKEQLRSMYPSDGLYSPRDIELATEINRFASYIDEIEANKQSIFLKDKI